MPRQNKTKSVKKSQLHSRNPHKGRYNFSALIKSLPELKRYIKPNPKGDMTIDFSNDKAVVCLNKALLAHHYHIKNWQIPKGYLCPPIPGRADYIHHLADLLENNRRLVPKGGKVKVLDIGTGASCIYPIIGSQAYGWAFVATEVDPLSIESAKVIIESNDCLKKRVKLVEQTDRKAIFKGVINGSFTLTMCNPPFHASMSEARKSTHNKIRNLNTGKKGANKMKRNFGGCRAELCYPGGETAFIKKMAKESVGFAKQVSWFTTLVSKGEHVRDLKRLLVRLGAKQVEVVKMSQGQKISRFIAWSFLTEE